MPFLQPLLLFGLAAVSIPIIIHLLNRRRYEVVDWGAMRFLQMSKVTRRRLFIEELLLMLMRMALIALLVLALAGLIWGDALLAWLLPHRSRAVVFVFDGSASMNAAAGGKTPQDAAKDWAAEYIKGLAPGDTVAVIQARQQVLPIVAEPSRDLQHYVADAIRDMPRPSGGCNLPAAVEEAHKILAGSGSGDQDVIVLTDGQAFGWSDGDTQERWRHAAKRLKHMKPGLWVVNVDPDRKPNPPNWSLDPLTLKVDFPVIPVQSEVTFHTYIVMHGTAKYVPPPKGLELSVDGQYVKRVPAPPASGSDEKKAQVTFTHRFATTGTHLVTLSIKPDDDQDVLPDDNHVDYVVQVTNPIPILYVDGNPDAAALQNQIRRQPLFGALNLEKDPTPAVKVTPVSISDFTPKMLTSGSDDERPRVLILCNVPSLNDEQQKAIATFVENGGGVLATLGERVDKDAYNKMYNGAEGWLPAPLTGMEAAEKRPDDEAHIDLDGVAHPATQRYGGEQQGDLAAAGFSKWWAVEDGTWYEEKIRPVLEKSCYECHSDKAKKVSGGLRLDSRDGLMKGGDHGPAVVPGDPEHSLLLTTIGPNAVLTTPAHGALSRDKIDDLTTWVKKGAWWGKDADYGARAGMLKSPTARYPFLVERQYKAGRVLLCTVPLGDEWSPDLPTLTDYVPLVHDLVYYLAGDLAHVEEFNLKPGLPIVYPLKGDAAATGFRLQTPVGGEKPLSVGAPTLDAFPAQETPKPRRALVCNETREAGVYQLTTPEDRKVYYVVEGAAGESELEASSEAQRAAVAEIMPMQYQNDPIKVLTDRKSPDRPDSWSLVFLAAMILLLCAEVWMTRRMVKNRS